MARIRGPLRETSAIRRSPRDQWRGRTFTPATAKLPVSAARWRNNAAVNAEAVSSPQVGRARIAYLVQLGVFALLAMFGPAAYVVTGDSVILDLGMFAGFPWSIPLMFVDPQVVPLAVSQALVIPCAALNVALLAALLRFAWVKTNRGTYTDSRDGTRKVCTLAGGSLLLVVLAALGVVYGNTLAPALIGSAVVLMMARAMFYLLPWRWVAHSLLVVGVCVAVLWGLVAMVLVGLENSNFPNF